MATIRDVARAAGVSPATISRVLAKPEIVSAEMRERVTRVIEELNYAPHPVAASLKTRRTGKILVSVPDISNPFFATVIRGMEETAAASGYSVVLGDTREDRDREEQYGRIFYRREVDGFLFLGHRLPGILAGMVAQSAGRAPIVNACAFDPNLGVSSAHIDNRKAAEAAMAALYSAGHSAIALITGPPASPLTQDRLAGAQDAARAQGSIERLQIAAGDFSIESGFRQALRLVRSANRPTGLFCFSDEMAIGALAAIRAGGLRCPQDVSVMGFDDIRTARYSYPPLSTIRQPMHLIGQRATELLLSILRGDLVRPVTATLPYKLVLRQSLGPVPGSTKGRSP